MWTEIELLKFDTVSQLQIPCYSLQEEICVNKGCQLKKYKNSAYIKNNGLFKRKGHIFLRQLDSLNQDQNIDHKLPKVIYRITVRLIKKNSCILRFYIFYEYNIKQQNYLIRMKQIFGNRLKKNFRICFVPFYSISS